MRFMRLRRNPEALERAKQADKQADERLSAAKEDAAWARRALAVNHLTERFLADLRHGGKA